MAVDSRDKRFSMIGLLQPVPSIFPNPDGTIGTQDRAQYDLLYHGIALDAPVAVVPPKNVRRFISNVNRLGLR